MTITIDDEQYDAQEISQLYTAAVIKTGDGEETTQVSMAWVEKEGKGKVEIVGYGLFVHFGDEDKESFIYDTKEEMDAVAARISEQIKKQRDGR